MKKGKTAKRTYSKRKITSSAKSKMSLREKELMAITIFAFFVFAFLLATINPSESNYVKVTGHQVAEEENGLNQIEDVKIDFSNIGTFLEQIIDPAKANATVIKWLIFFCFVFGLWGLLYFFKGKEGKPSNPFFMILAVPIAFAMTYLLEKQQILAGIIPYSALGLAIIVGAPFIAIFFGSLKLLEGKRSLTKTVAQLMAWYFYLACLLYFLVLGFINQSKFSFWVLIIMCVGVIFSIIIIVKNKPWTEWLAKVERRVIEKNIKDVQHALGVRESGGWNRGERTLEHARGSMRKDQNY